MLQAWGINAVLAPSEILMDGWLMYDVQCNNNLQWRMNETTFPCYNTVFLWCGSFLSRKKSMLESKHSKLLIFNRLNHCTTILFDKITKENILSRCWKFSMKTFWKMIEYLFTSQLRAIWVPCTCGTVQNNQVKRFNRPTIKTILSFV